MGSPKRKGRENSSPNKLRNSPSLQDSILLKAQLQQAKEDAERDTRQWKAALEEEREASQRLQQQLYQLQESDSLVATAAANSQQQVHQLRQQLESEKSRAAVLDANLQVGLLLVLELFRCCCLHGHLRGTSRDKQGRAGGREGGGLRGKEGGTASWKGRWNYCCMPTDKNDGMLYF